MLILGSMSGKADPSLTLSEKPRRGVLHGEREIHLVDDGDGLSLSSVYEHCSFAIVNEFLASVRVQTNRLRVSQ